eukprot:7914288-Lingulodinium_polyedra.AAC.1
MKPHGLGDARAFAKLAVAITGVWSGAQVQRAHFFTDGSEAAGRAGWAYVALAELAHPGGPPFELIGFGRGP